jgi:hypothetical protein
MLEKYDGLSTMRREMEQASLLLGSARTSAMTAKWADNETEIKLAASLAELKSMVGAQCPECGQALTEACLAEAA